MLVKFGDSVTLVKSEQFWNADAPIDVRSLGGTGGEPGNGTATTLAALTCPTGQGTACTEATKSRATRIVCCCFVPGEELVGGGDGVD